MGLIASSSYIGYLVAMAISSVISEKLGPRYTILLGGIVACSGLLMIAFSTNQWFLITGVIIAGMSPGLAYPPLSDVIVLMLKKNDRDVAYSIINSGTSIGIIISAPIALLVGEQWRIAWVVFAFFALGATIWNSLVITRKKIKIARHDVAQANLIRWLFNQASFKLFIYAFFLGIVTSVYWTFSVEYITIKNSELFFLHWQISKEVFSKIFWIAVGISGLFGGTAAFFTKALGLKKMLQISMLFIVSSILILTVFHSSWFGLLFSSLLFGGTFILSTALIGIWSIFVFYDRPSFGFGAAFLLLSFGQLVGPAFFGMLITNYGMDMMFYISAFVGLVFSFIKPKEEIYNMTPEGVD